MKCKLPICVECGIQKMITIAMENKLAASMAGFFILIAIVSFSN